MIEGRIQTRSWDDKGSGEKKYRTEIVAESVQFGAKAGGFGGSSGQSSSEAPATKASSKAAKEVDTIDYPSEDINPEDIPF